ncbi:autoinducer binding domain-containing protein [Methylobrevis pamukkalensis]|uniref:Transcriptional activator protein LuxR n=1 Tax=Methylobrevis pamukkalensis TaxID=1439726 RepID=A0A1E3H8C8_9HYPH|nr:autoinducer binding domain-containing protein [Methylobrevis pamukkalensis]ODN72570.1 Transcriptional activator protein LuxR [Methylobrevis pamukkalensis]
MTDYQRALDAIERIKSLGTADEIMAELQEVARSVGFDGFMMTGLPDPGDRIDGYLMLRGWDPRWTEHYLARDFVQHDPVVARIRATSKPFMWDEAVTGQPLSGEASTVMHEAADFGLRAGFSVPIYSTSGFQAVISFAGGPVDLREQHKGLLHLVGIYAHNQARECLARGVPMRRPPKLSPREIECLRWAADGKTSWEIAQILSISNHTADGYLTSATRKLRAVNRVQAVAEAFRHGLIH